MAAMRSRKPKNCKSAVVLAQMIDAEGFTPVLASAIKRYEKRVLPPYMVRKIAERKRAFSEMVHLKLSEVDRIVLGKYLGHMAKMNFDAGLRVGLGCSIALAKVEE